MTILPFDIIEKIIATIALELDDLSFSTTKRCSVVCSEWLPVCRKHIFASIIVSPSASFLSLASDLRITLPTFHKRLITSPDIGHYVRDLKYIDSIRGSHLDDPVFIDVFTKLPRLQSFRVYAGQVEWNHIRSPFLQIFNISPLSRLSIVGVENLIPADLASCKSLEKLHLSCTTFSTSHSTSDISHIPLRIQHLSVEDWSVAEAVYLGVLRCMDGTAFLDFSRLTFLSIKISSADMANSARALLHICGHLESLEIKTDIFGSKDQGAYDSLMLIILILMDDPYTEDGKDTFIPIHFSSLSTLKSLKSLALESLLYVNSDPYLFLTDELKNMANQNIIEKILIKIHVMGGFDEYYFDAGTWEWGKLDEVFQYPGWPNLRYISLTIVTHNLYAGASLSYVEDFQMLEKTHFPWLSSSKSVFFMFSVQ
ncbi:hypothetical protein BDN70DRAFT_937134 [Pholiota conissans]|uniref:F-box domain-containing protein n=1 Tax=Pholiota conissans TaxID=109636 RepID=A0A9P6CUD7_9AGAR|nr:hypothetical protein BDN70DRAFT_937134 [Pholiota conissans]